MAGIVIEQLGRGGGPGVFHKLPSLPVRVGRAPANDVILADPYVSPFHLTIEESDRGWVVADCTSTNGTFIGKGTRIGAPVELQSGDFVQAGRTVLRLLAPSHEVPQALPFKPRRSRAATVIIPPLAVGSLLGTFVFAAADRFLDTLTEVRLITILAEALPFMFFPLLWAGIWALAGFMVKRRADFGLQLIVANCAFILFFTAAGMAEWLEYATSSVGVSNVAGYAGMGTLAVALLFVNLNIATGIADLRRAFIAVCIGGGIVATIAVSDHAQNAGNELAPRYSQTLKPPVFPVIKTVTIDQFFEKKESLFRGAGKPETGKQKSGISNPATR